MGNIKRYRSKNKIDFSQPELLEIIDNIISNSFYATKIAAIDWIHDYVPKRTGQLRDSLINWINANWIIDSNGITISLGTSVEYFDKILGNVIHTGTWHEHNGSPATAYYYGYSGRIYLNDPKANINWKNLIATFIKTTFLDNLRSYRDLYLRGS